MVAATETANAPGANIAHLAAFWPKIRPTDATTRPETNGSANPCLSYVPPSVSLPYFANPPYQLYIRTPRKTGKEKTTELINARG